ncbi:MAG TPA: enoyl-CoA hydratase/isomerase family protein [Devosiaceae bacterium]|jgi:enoyl-CoA hydratase/carnithine racemase
MSYENIIYEKRDGVGIVTLNRPEYLNATSPGIHADLIDVFEQMLHDSEVRVTVLTGNGRAFCAGAYVKDKNKHVVNGPSRVITPRSSPRFLTRLWQYPKPLISAVNGLAYGEGFNMVLCSDLIVASEEAKFCFPMAKLGIIPNTPGVAGLALYVGKARAMEIAMLAKPLEAKDAFNAGLVNRLVSHENLMTEALSIADDLAGLAPISVWLIKDDLRHSLEHHIDFEGTQMRDILTMMSSDREEGHRAWREKRKPVFRGE